MRFELGESDLHKCVDLRENCFPDKKKFSFFNEIGFMQKSEKKKRKKCLIMEKKSLHYTQAEEF